MKLRGVTAAHVGQLVRLRVGAWLGAGVVSPNTFAPQGSHADRLPSWPRLLPTASLLDMHTHHLLVLRYGHILCSLRSVKSNHVSPVLDCLSN
jgi:hypothetical protein